MYNRNICKRVEPLNEIIEGLFLGDHAASEASYLLKRHGITHILSVGSGLYPRFPKKFTYKWVSELDSPNANLRQHFSSCHEFINNAFAAGGRILVHCYAGVSRSATIVISWLMKEREMNFSSALSHVTSRRWFINPNPGFRR